LSGRDTPERQRQELEFSSAPGTVLQVEKGFVTAETGRAYARLTIRGVRHSTM